ncbi:hypothetical protein ES707_09489 [subsurface metagenome]
MLKSAAAHARPRDAESLNDLSPFPPISNTKPTLSGASAAKTVEERHKLNIITNATSPNRFFFISEISFHF